MTPEQKQLWQKISDFPLDEHGLALSSSSSSDGGCSSGCSGGCSGGGD